MADNMHRKRNLLVAISLIILAALLLSSCSGKNKVKLSKMDDRDLMQALTDFGVEVPEVEGIMGWIRATLAELEVGLTRPPPIYGYRATTYLSDKEIQVLYRSLRSLVIYYQSINN